ncbi:MAG: hypothetical protein Fur0011_1240 [Candidatus Microgenomates bacterium]
MTIRHTSFDSVYNLLNSEQKRAVDTIYGPLLVLAGPGTGKTQLLSARVANILKVTDTTPGNILCLTFTESGAANMRNRLRDFIGSSAYEVTISTYHSFGSDIIKRYSSYFQQIQLDRSDDMRLERPIDELSQIKIIDSIVAKLPFDSPLLSARYYLKDVVKTISDLKQSLYTPDSLRALANSNLAQIDAVQPMLDTIFNNVGGISRKKEQLMSQYETLLETLSHQSGSLIELASAELATAYDQSQSLRSSKPLTVWKNKYLFKDEYDRLVFTSRDHSEKMLELANIFEAYEKELRAGAMYDFNDMILRAISGIKNNNELRYNLQERYQYILLDEFQDTNPSQFALVKLLCDHPVHEGRPNVMAVGDDDQAIFAFQGASIGNIQDFLDSFRDVVVINLVHNYRSHKDVLHVALNVRSQIGGELHHKLSGINKNLLSSNHSLPKDSTIIRSEHASVASEYAWVAEQIKQLVASGTSPEQIAVIAPKHSVLEEMVPFLTKHSLPVTYEKRENILESTIVKILYQSVCLLDALITNDIARINQYFPLVLSHPYWNIPPLDLWQINWQLGKSEETRSWAEIAVGVASLSPAITFYLKEAGLVSTSTLETTLDRLVNESPLKNYYFERTQRIDNALQYYQAITYLSTIRNSLRSYQTSQEKPLTLTDFLNFFAMYEKAGEGLINSHPITQGKSSIQLMTAYRAKGLEFDHVFILQTLDEVWGSSSRSRSSNLALPPNLKHIRYDHGGDDERLRLFYVALTRARIGLYLSSHTHKDDGKVTTPLKYLGDSGGLSPHLPPGSQQIKIPKVIPLELGEQAATLWTAGRLTLAVNFHDLLEDHLLTYLMSPTHLNTFMDLEHGGPEEFLVNTLLRFPSAPTLDSEYGQAIHKTLEWYQQNFANGTVPTLPETISFYTKEVLSRYLNPLDRENILSRGVLVLNKYLPSRANMFKTPALTEVNFKSEGVSLGEARLTGKIDRLEIDNVNKTLRIVDFKTGSSISNWNSSLKAYKYRQQLYFYKLLIEGSCTWSSYKVIDARLEFVEPNNFKDGKLSSPLIIQFDQNDEEEIKRLIKVVWDKIQRLDLPLTDKYSSNLQGTKAFERDLLAEIHGVT